MCLHVGVKIATSKALWSELLMVKRKWYIIGTKLKLSIIRLSEIKEENQNNPDKCLTALCKELVSPSKPGSSACTWNAIVEVLRTDLVNEKELASKLEQHYCWLESPNSKTWVRLSLYTVKPLIMDTLRKDNLEVLLYIHTL